MVGAVGRILGTRTRHSRSLTRLFRTLKYITHPLFLLSLCLAGTKYRNERMFGVTDVHSDTTETYRIVGEGIATEFKKMPKEFAKIAREAKSVGQTAMEKTKGGFRSTAREKGKTSESKSASSTLRSSPEKLSADARDAEARGHSAFAKILKNQSQSQKQKLEKEKGPFEEQDFDDDFEGGSIML